MFTERLAVPVNSYCLDLYEIKKEVLMKVIPSLMENLLHEGLTKVFLFQQNE